MIFEHRRRSRPALYQKAKKKALALAKTSMLWRPGGDEAGHHRVEIVAVA